MKPGRLRRPADTELPRQRCNGDAVTLRARAIIVAGRAKLALTRSVDAVLANEIAIVNEVTLGWSLLRRDVDVTAVAIANVPLVLVLVASEARRHRWFER